MQRPEENLSDLNNEIQQQSDYTVSQMNIHLELENHEPQKFQPSPTSLQHQLYQRYSSSQSYFYSKCINDIVKEKQTKNNLNYGDIQCFCEDEENLKRYYQNKQYQRKMSAYKQYYYYHEDCPRIFIQKIENIYEKWHEKKRDIIYKKLKFMYNEDYNSSDNSNSTNQLENENELVISHFLMNLSQYNPYSKKYYLRVQAKQEKERQQRNKLKQGNVFKRSKLQLSDLNHELSMMLEEINDISTISTLQNHQIADNNLLKTNIARKLRKSIPDMRVEERSRQKNRNSQFRVNFKKNNLQPVLPISYDHAKKQSLSSLKSRQLVNFKTNIDTGKVKGHHKNLSSIPNTNIMQNKKWKVQIPQQQPLPSPQYPSSQLTPKLREADNPKMKSIFSISSLTNTNHKIKTNNNQLASGISLKFTRNDGITSNNTNLTKVPKIILKSNPSNTEGNLKRNKNSRSEKGIGTRQQSNGKNLRKTDNYAQQRTSSLKKYDVHIESMKKLKNPKQGIVEQFSDKRFTGTGSTNFRSYRSEHSESQYRVKLNLGTSKSKNKSPVQLDNNPSKSRKNIYQKN